ncbi:nuclear transport factor 2 family protein [Croceicoccus ponticola]|uniref:Nuclear transport factor 2 family protein n=1 Tax=Croceicoccus ponticola TaxID=2217664 RepID=A0A437GV10_9SPHN|nr:nuclear transport factor 2 family protein [Croceicoccus ponticola]RVQ65162.1 nuclear transport factor 2 family protein [Croceicoccus ponticola]
MNGTLDRLAAESAIKRVIHLYCHALDRRRWELLDQVFHEDAKYGFGDIAGSWRDFLAAARSIVDPLGPTQHMVANILISIEGDVAHVETYLNGYHVIPADYPAGLNTNGLFYDRPGERYVSVVGGRYVDRFEQRDGDWRIAQRAGIYDWIQVLPYTDGGLSQSPDAALGKWGPSDASMTVVRPLYER